MTTTNEKPLVEVHDGVEYELEPVHYKTKCVGLAPTQAYDGLEAMLEKMDDNAVFALAIRQLKQDVKNAVRAKYNKDNVSATTIINAQASGELTIEMMQAAKKDYDAGKYEHNWTRCCAAQLGLGDDALAKANPSHIHWDCAR